MSDKSNRSTSLDRVEKAYPHPVLKAKLENYAQATQQSKSSIMCEALDAYLKDKNIPIIKHKE